MALERSITAKGRCKETRTEAWYWNGLTCPKDGVGELDIRMVLKEFIIAYGRCNETGTEEWS